MIEVRIARELTPAGVGGVRWVLLESDDAPTVRPSVAAPRLVAVPKPTPEQTPERTLEQSPEPWAFERTAGPALAANDDPVDHVNDAVEAMAPAEAVAPTAAGLLRPLDSFTIEPPAVHAQVAAAARAPRGVAALVAVAAAALLVGAGWLGRDAWWPLLQQAMHQVAQR